MASPLVRTSTPGIYKRGRNYVVKQRDRRGRMHTKSAPTIAAARQLQATMRSDSARGELHVGTRESLEPYAREWIRTYTGRTSRGFRESTREETWKDMRAGKFALMTPVSTSTEGRCVAMIMWMPTARASWARRAMQSSTSARASIMRSASSSMTQTM